MSLTERSTGKHMGAGGSSGVALRLAVMIVVVVAFVGLSTWCLDISMGHATAKSVGERNWNFTLVLKIPAAAIKHAEPSAPPAGFAAGDTIGRIMIPRMSLDSAVVEMANCEDQANLNRGPSHIHGTAVPGAAGNCAIAGHRSTYTEPFAQMGMLQAGDEIDLVRLSGVKFVYRVTQIWVVSPDQVSVLDPTPQPSLTLITCHPAGSARSRLIVRAVRSD